MKMQVRLEFKYIFQESERQTIEECLKNISNDTLIKTIGFFATKDIHWSNFFSNPEKQSEINKKIQKLNGEISLISTESSLHLAERILEYKDELLDDNNKDVDRDEINLFKAILLINEELNKYDEAISKSNKEDVDKIIDMMISIKFSSYDLGVYDEIWFEITKLYIVTLYKFSRLLDFLQSDSKYSPILECLYTNFGQNSVEELVGKSLFLLTKTHEITTGKEFGKISLEDNNDISVRKFFDSLISENVYVDTNFLQLKKNPLYKIDENTYSIINPFFVLDKFTNSLRFFISKNRTNNIDDDLKKKLKNNAFYSEDFSEKYLMKNILDDIFQNKCFIKKKQSTNVQGEPDYYVRDSGKIFLFEYKDAYINAKTKVSRDIDLIEKVLKIKFLKNQKEKPKGIGQLIRHIKNISQNNFPFDDSIKKSVVVYPILLLSHRLLEVPGINYKLNKWFKEELNKNTNIGKNITVKDLVIIDMDTLIFYKAYYKENKNNFCSSLEKHIKKSKGNHNGYGNNENDVYITMQKKLLRKILPYSFRMQDLVEQQIYSPKMIKEYIQDLKKYFKE
ncbi:hypothetical protein ACILE8_01495 [Capnocytophaga canimorsus]|uniref:hypothetical protein n=1 Tax=Capnocytophaga canimorsus TaxID=28188 RepID=UPI0037CFE521